MPLPTEIAIPAELLPRDGRFGSGPSKVERTALDALATSGSHYMGTSHRQPVVRSVVAEIREGLRRLYALPDDYEVVLGVGGATAFWDAAAFGLIQRRSQHAVFGEFSGKFADVARGAPHLGEPDIIATSPGTHPQLRTSPNVDLYALTHNETSTGVMMPVERPPGGTGLVVVDATSAAGAMEVRHDEYDTYYFSLQKAFGSDGGLWIAICSPAAVDRIESIATSGRWIPPFLSLRSALANSRKNQTTNTPALATLFLVRHQLDRMNEQGGLQWAVERSQRSSSMVYEWAAASDYATPFVGDPTMRSTTVATIDLVDRIQADDVEAALRANGIVDTGGYRKLGRNQLRIACFPNVDPDDVAALIGAIDYIIERLD